MSQVDTDLEQRIEAIFDKADDLMINKKQYKEAVTSKLILIYKLG
jgi:hypothetical protein